MKDQIFLLNAENKLYELNESDFVTEDQFQALLENYPSLISGSQINPENPRKWILIAREVGVPGEEGGSNIWSLDHLFIDQDGIPTLVEVKRSTDTRIRREVVGQILDYAANSVSYWSIEEIRIKYQKRCEEQNIDPEIELSDLIGEEGDIERFWETVKTNLKAGKIRLLFVADKIPKELQRIIEFLNEQMSPAEVLGVEIKQYANGEMKTLVPRVIGKTSSAEATKQNRPGTQWTEDTFFAELERLCGINQVNLVREMIGHLIVKGVRLWYGSGKKTGSIVPVMDLGEHNPLFAIGTSGYLELYFQYYKNPFDDLTKKEELRRKFETIEGVVIPGDKLTKRPSFRIEILLKNNNLQIFLNTVDWMLDEMKRVQK